MVGGVLAANVATARAGTSRPEEPTAQRVYVVRSGDTLWRIAREQAPSRSADLRPLVDRLIQVNHLQGATIRPGQQLVLPS